MSIRKALEVVGKIALCEEKCQLKIVILDSETKKHHVYYIYIREEEKHLTCLCYLTF